MAVYLISGVFICHFFACIKKITRSKNMGFLTGMIRKIADTQWLSQNLNKVTGNALSKFDHFLDKLF